MFPGCPLLQLRFRQSDVGACKRVWLPLSVVCELPRDSPASWWGPCTAMPASGTTALTGALAASATACDVMTSLVIRKLSLASQLRAPG